jgi:hypothetical protein
MTRQFKRCAELLFKETMHGNCPRVLFGIAYMGFSIEKESAFVA